MIAINPEVIGIGRLGLVYMIIGLANRDKWSKENNMMIESIHYKINN